MNVGDMVKILGVRFEGVENENTIAFEAQPTKKEESTMFKCDPMSIKNVYFNDPVTVVMWNDGTKTIVRCSENDFYDPEKGLAMAIIKKVYGNDNKFHKIFKKWLPDEDDAEPDDFKETIEGILSMMREKYLYGF